MNEFFPTIQPIQYEGPESTNPFAFKHYQADKLIMGKTMAEHLRMAACYWHNFCWQGSDVFGAATFQRPWFNADTEMQAAKLKADAAFEFFSKLGISYYSFHDVDIAPEGKNIREYIDNFSEMVDVLEAKQASTGMKLLWGTANAFSNPRFMSGAASNPNPEIFAYAATQVCHAMQATHRLKGENYVLWGGREGYETLLNTDLKRERNQLGRFMQMVVEHKHAIGFQGTLLIEPKPAEPTKHQYDYDTATVFGFLKEFGLENEIKVNIEANHATLAGHSFHHEIATACSLGILGSIDANQGDPQLGWDTDQFPTSVEEYTLATYEILKSGGFQTGGYMFDTKLRRQSIDLEDLFHGHIGAMDTLALSLEKAATMLEEQTLNNLLEKRYEKWQDTLGQNILSGNMTLSQVAEYVETNDLNPSPESGRQEMLENLVNGYIRR
ncbi:xylose isomerase [Marinomonas aquiplantarum]|uniref:Xylose isomerase n=1 Tax=Marinomonas aquiplantarum TaxID=491951 RepID=A0A366CT68_9GAMM|nr:xylose isomerase [Marinomonas aquiplantarum]RBO78556.1 D-xylose isomerase [Marinomonas aquiplantarum]